MDMDYIPTFTFFITISHGNYIDYSWATYTFILSWQECWIPSVDNTPHYLHNEHTLTPLGEKWI